MAAFVNVGFGNVVNSEKIVSMVSTEAAPVRRLIQNARDEGRAVDATCGRRTRTALILESGHVVLSALTTDTIAARCNQNKAVWREEEQYG
ncbi:MAG: DUF370 domain-containing protein [Eubacterium sp.]|nr:DUF370 domain-containing protein [Eubacterium sp.]